MAAKMPSAQKMSRAVQSTLECIAPGPAAALYYPSSSSWVSLCQTLSTREVFLHLHAKLVADKFHLGDTVKVHSDVAYVKCLAEGHGDWTSAMAQYCNQEGHVIQISGSGDARVRFADGTDWNYHPAALQKL
mmetsp:Transcript_71192/g.133152  ORF Transcript_71192/g.133152 Transcript_71192/m.133152 type:complete len:132 (+) Transcript_71192:81-476(+)